MSYVLTVEPKAGYLHARVTGRNTLDNVVAYLREIGAECRARGYDRVLIEECLEGPRLDLRQVTQVVHSAVTPTELPTIAYVDVNASSGHMPIAGDLANLRGIQIAVFGTLADAARWLRELPSPEAVKS